MKIELENSPPEIRDRIIVVAIAPAVIIPKALCFDSFNYASKTDPISHLGTALGGGILPLYTTGMARQEGYKELILLDPHPDAPFFDHAFTSPTFNPVLKNTEKGNERSLSFSHYFLFHSMSASFIKQSSTSGL